MFGGLYGDLPPPSSNASEVAGGRGGDGAQPATTGWSTVNKWSSSTILAPPTVRKPSLFAPPTSVLRAQGSAVAAAVAKAKTLIANSAPSILGSRVVSGVAIDTSSSAGWSTHSEDDRASGAAAGGGGGGIVSSEYDAADVVNVHEIRLPPATGLVGVSAAVVEEYDPGRPNDYDEYCRERRRRRVEEEMRKEVERRRREEDEKEREREIQSLRQREREKEREAERDIEREKEAEQARALLHISGEEAWRRRAMLSAAKAGGADVSLSPPAGTAALRDDSGRAGGTPSGGNGGNGSGLGAGPGGGMSAAQRIMQKMGWKEGMGLGKAEQGITTPLLARKTDRRSGVIVNASEQRMTSSSATVVPAVAPTTPVTEKKPRAGVAVPGPPTRVLLLRNMVGPGEVDDELEDEVAGECTKYGPVVKVLIFEITEPNFPVTEAVRIFVLFERTEHAMKGLIDLDGRFFGGRVVRAGFYDEDKFMTNQLAPSQDELAAGVLGACPQ